MKSLIQKKNPSHPYWRRKFIFFDSFHPLKRSSNFCEWIIFVWTLYVRFYIESKANHTLKKFFNPWTVFVSSDGEQCSWTVMVNSIGFNQIEGAINTGINPYPYPYPDLYLLFIIEIYIFYIRIQGLGLFKFLFITFPLLFPFKQILTSGFASSGHGPMEVGCLAKPCKCSCLIYIFIWLSWWINLTHKHKLTYEHDQHISYKF